MSKCTAAQALDAFAYWLGYYEKATSAYATTRDKSAFEKNKGSGNFTYAGYFAGCQGGAWCAMQVSLALVEACGGDKNAAKALMYGVYPYYNCGQIWDAAPGSAKFRRGAGTPKPGDIVVFTNNGTSRDHTGMVYAVDSHYVYTYEGNSSNMARKRAYALTSTYIYGYIRLPYADGGDPSPVTPELYGAIVYPDIGLHMLSKGCTGPEVKTIQRILYSRSHKGADGKPITADGDFGKNTKAALIKLQKELGIEQDGVVGKDTWKAALTNLD